MFLPDTVELGSGVLSDLGLDILDIALIEWTRLPILEDHQVDVFLCRKSETGKDFEGRASNTT